MNNSMVGYVALAVQSFVIFMALSENGGDIMSLCSINVRVSDQHKCPQLGS